MDPEDLVTYQIVGYILTGEMVKLPKTSEPSLNHLQMAKILITLSGSFGRRKK